MANGRRSRSHAARRNVAAQRNRYSSDDSPETRIGRRVTVQPDGCWIYNGEPTRYGVHRFVYETLIGPIPPQYQLHHSCLTPGCCNPHHLRPVRQPQHRAIHALMESDEPDRKSATALLKDATLRLRAAGRE